MALAQRQIQTQTLLLSQQMQQSLHLLQLPVLELQSYLEEAALSNPMLDVELPSLGSGLSELVGADSGEDVGPKGFPISRRERVVWVGDAEPRDIGHFASGGETFSEHLLSQLGQMRDLSGVTLALSEFLVGCLASSGYLDCPLQELSRELNCSLFDLEQALFVVQSLDPIGVGARNLSECLLLQLVQSRHFTALNIDLVRRGLPLLGKNDYAGLSRMLRAPEEDVRAAAAYIRTLNPIPSRGFRTEAYTQYAVPEATLRWESGSLQIEMNDSVQPHVSLSRENCALMDGCDEREIQLYLKRNYQEAKNLISNLDYRQDTLFRLLRAIVQLQSGFFVRGEPLIPMTMSQVADALRLNISTVSRAVKDKYIQYQGKVYALRSLFTAAIQTADGGLVSADSAKRRIRDCVAAEDPARPLSDRAICSALAGLNIALSRRTVAKYRSELGIPSAAQRRRAK